MRRRVSCWELIFGIPMQCQNCAMPLSQYREKSGPSFQAEYAKTRGPDDPASFDDLLSSRDSLLDVKVRVNMIIKSFDNEIVISHLNKMRYVICDSSPSPHKLLLSDRPVCFSNLKAKNGMAFLPISPTKLYVAVNEDAALGKINKMKPKDIVKNVNLFVVGRARQFVWSIDRSQNNFINKYMSKQMEPMPLFSKCGSIMKLPKRFQLNKSHFVTRRPSDRRNFKTEVVSRLGQPFLVDGRIRVHRERGPYFPLYGGHD